MYSWLRGMYATRQIVVPRASREKKEWVLRSSHPQTGGISRFRRRGTRFCVW
jgi:hypothetical protein